MENFIEYLYSKFLQSDGVSIDTRTIQPGNLFFALKGPNFNANKYAAKALEAGASYAVVDDPTYATDERIIVAPDAQQAFQDLAVFHRKKFKRKVLGITGSNGKTTTKELCKAVLEKKFVVHATVGNYNNHLGVPLTLLHIHPQVEVAIVEMGANHIGEIAGLCKFAMPDYGIITNIGEAHTETFGGIEGVLRGKSELFDYLKKTDGKPIINMSDPRLSHMPKRFSNAILFPSEDLKMVRAAPFLEVHLSGRPSRTNLIGAYNFGNIAAAIAVGREFGVPDADILDAIEGYLPSNHRSQWVEKDHVNILVDCYNANPTSMMAAIENFEQLPDPKTWILGDMNEVEDSDNRHRQVGEKLKDYTGEVIFIGEKMKQATKELRSAKWFPNAEEAGVWIKEHPLKGNVLLKASRTIKLEKLLDII